jgi:hypothetical protein
MITKEKLIATKVVLSDGSGKHVLFVHGYPAQLIADSLNANFGGMPDVAAQVNGGDAPRRRGRRAKSAETAKPEAAA